MDSNCLETLSGLQAARPPLHGIAGIETAHDLRISTHLFASYPSWHLVLFPDKLRKWRTPAGIFVLVVKIRLRWTMIRPVISA